jgi:hypothetical protein
VSDFVLETREVQSLLTKASGLGNDKGDDPESTRPAVSRGRG